MTSAVDPPGGRGRISVNIEHIVIYTVVGDRTEIGVPHKEHPRAYQVALKAFQ